MLTRILAELDRQRMLLDWHRGTPRGDHHQTQITRIMDRLAKCERADLPSSAFRTLLAKARSHKYLRRVPKPGGGWRYFYGVGGGRGLAHADELVQGAKFRHKDGHLEVVAEHGGKVLVRHDETGALEHLSRDELRRRLHGYHAEAIDQHRARLLADLTAGGKSGTARQRERLAARAARYDYFDAPEVRALLQIKPDGLEHLPARPRPVVVQPYSKLDRTWERDLPTLSAAGLHTYADVLAAGRDTLADLLGDRRISDALFTTAQLRGKSKKAVAKAIHPTDHPDWVPDLGSYDTILINTSGGKDSQAMMDRVMELADQQGIDRSKIVAVHADLGRVEWEGTKELAQQQSDHYGIRMEVVQRQKNDLLQHIEVRYYQLQGRIEDTTVAGLGTWGDLFDLLPAPKADKRAAESKRYKAEMGAAVAALAAKLPEHLPTHPPQGSLDASPSLAETVSRKQRAAYLLESAARKRKDKDPAETLSWGAPNPWPDSGSRFCTSEHKRADIRKLMTALAKQAKAKNGKGHKPRILNAMGLRAQESTERANKLVFDRSDASSGAREVDDWLPISGWTEEQVWDNIKASGVPHHAAYDLGMRRLSCVFCVFADGHDLLTAATHNPDLFQQYVELEKRTGFTYQMGKYAKGSEEGAHPAYASLAGQPKSFAAVADALRDHRSKARGDLGLVAIGEPRAPQRLAKSSGGDLGAHTLHTALHVNLGRLRAAGHKVTAVQYDYRPSGSVIQLDTDTDSYYCGALAYPDAYAGSTASAIMARAFNLDYEEHGSPDRQER
jgi:3'-phosphoadenosine 5'-phosphosulfate sulfotransferase (PAPS reductase)/FAD synthetase